MNDLSLDRPDLQFAAKELCRMMADDRMLEKAQEVGKVSCELPTPHREIRGHWDRPQ